MATGASDTVAPSRRTSAWPRAVAWLERHALPFAGLTIIATLLLSQAHKHLNQDGWLGLVAGREVAHNGIPQHDPLMFWTLGERWIDQQWLSQLAFYGLHSLGGLALVTIVYVLLAVGSLALAIAAARAAGATETHILWVLPLAGFLFMAAAVETRTQGFAYPLFVAVLWLLVTDERRPSARTYAVFPIIVLWANLHGSVALGVGLIGLYGLVALARVLVEGPRDLARIARPLAFCVLPVLCLLVTPYGLDGLTYYRETIFSGQFRNVITEWQPITSVWIIAWPFFILAFACVYVFGRSRGRASAYEQLALLALMVATISTIRNIVWFALALLILLPPILGAAFEPRPPAPRRTRINLAIAGTSLAALVIGTIAVAAQPQHWFEKGYDARTLDVVASAAQRDPGLRIYAEGRFADWLLWHHPELRGRIAYDSRLELLSNARLKAVADLSTVTGTRFARAINGFGLLVLEPEGHPKATKAMLALSGTTPIFRGDKVIVARYRQR